MKHTMRSTLRRLKPYGSLLPVGIDRPHLQSYLLGIRDGWQQPYELSTSTNIEHLMKTVEHETIFGIQESLDAGINLGQWLRSPLNHQQPEPEHLQ